MKVRKQIINFFGHYHAGTSALLIVGNFRSFVNARDYPSQLASPLRLPLYQYCELMTATVLEMLLDV